jgi:hypothetical protein
MRLSDVVPPASWTIVMASGVIAIDLYDVHLLVLSMIVFGFAAAVWLFLAVVLGVPLVLRRGRFRRLAGSPVSLTAVAATAVLGTGFATYGYRVAAAVLLAMAGTGGRCSWCRSFGTGQPLPSGSRSSSASPPMAWPC